MDQSVVVQKKNIFVRVFLQGQLPYLKFWKWVMYVVIVLTPVPLFFNVNFTEFAKWGWYVLFGVLMARPMSQIFPELGIFRILIVLRRQFGIWSGVLLLCHLGGFLAAMKMTPFDLFKNPMFWAWNNLVTYGILGILVLIPVLFTSNDLSMRILKRSWKWVQRLSYLLFVFGAVHLYFMGKMEYFVEVVILLVVLVLAKAGVKIRLPFLRR